MDKSDPVAPIEADQEYVSGVRLDQNTANDPVFDLATVLMVDPRILIADTDPATELTRKMGEALAELSLADWLLLGQVVEENAA